MNTHKNRIRVLLVFVLGLLAASLSSCSSIQPWGHGGSSSQSMFGAGMSVPLGKK